MSGAGLQESLALKCCPAEARECSRRAGNKSIWLSLIFVLALLPFAGTFVLNYPDEGHYTDAAISMLQQGDWLTPRQGDEPRFHKPILTYWLVAAGYGVIGIDVLGGRLPFLVAGAAVVWLVYRLATKLTGSERSAWLAALITFSHPILMLSSVRSMPDVCLCLFMLVSASGFLRILILRERTVLNYFAAYVGAGLAVLSKGLLPVIFIVYAWVFVWLVRPHRQSWRCLVHVPAMLAGMILGGSWYALMAVKYGASFSGVFLGDQVGNHLSRSGLASMRNLIIYLGSYLVAFLPWTGLALVLKRTRVDTTNGWGKAVVGTAMKFTMGLNAVAAGGFGLFCSPQMAGRVPLGVERRLDDGEVQLGNPSWTARRASLMPATDEERSRALQQFILGWCACVSLVFALASHRSIRYPLPVAPLLGVLLGDWLGRAEPAEFNRAARRVLMICLLMLGVGAFGGAALLVALSATGAAAFFLALAALVGLGTVWLASKQRLESATALAAVLFLSLPCAFVPMKQFLLPDVSTLIAEGLERSGEVAPDRIAIAFLGSHRLAARVRVAAHGKISPTAVESLEQIDPLQQNRVVLPASDLPLLGGESWHIKPIARALTVMPKGNWRQALARGALREWIEQNKTTYVVAVRRGRPGHRMTTPAATEEP